MKLATVYERGGKLYVHGFSQTTAGMWVFCEPVLTPAEAPEEVGRAIRASLGASRGGIPHPSQQELDVLDRPLLALARATSFDDFAEGATCVQVSMQVGMNGEAITLIPLHNGGARGGFTTLEEKAQTITTDSDEELGSAVLAALAMAE
jgi:hypothetical protein